MITNGTALGPLLHQQRRVSPRHAAPHDFAGALYVTLDLTIGYRGVALSIPVTVNRNGRIYLGFGGGAGTTGVAVAARASWIGLGGQRPHNRADVNKFNGGWSITAAGNAPMGPAGAATWGTPGRHLPTRRETALEVGGAYGSGSVSSVATYSWNPFTLPSWARW